MNVQLTHECAPRIHKPIALEWAGSGGVNKMMVMDGSVTTTTPFVFATYCAMILLGWQLCLVQYQELGGEGSDWREGWLG